MSRGKFQVFIVILFWKLPQYNQKQFYKNHIYKKCPSFTLRKLLKNHKNYLFETVFES